MFHMRQEGAECRQGFNFMFKPHLQIFIFIGLYKNRYMFGVGYSFNLNKIYCKYRKRTMEDDFRSWVFMKDYVPLQDAMEYRQLRRSDPLKETIG